MEHEEEGHKSRKTATLESCLDENDQMELQFWSKKAGGREIPFNEFRTTLAGRYGEDVHGCTRRKWQELSIPNYGKLTVVDKGNFKIKFIDIWH